MLEEIIRAIAKFIEPAIASYDSDTFVAKTENLKEEEIRRLALFFARRFMREKESNGIYNEDGEMQRAWMLEDVIHVDGLQLEEVLGWIRGNEVDKDGR